MDITPTENAQMQNWSVAWHQDSMRVKDEMTVQHLYPHLDPIRQQLLGDALSANGAYDPTGADVPLRGWLQQHCPDATGPSPHGRSDARPPAMVRGSNLGRN